MFKSSIILAFLATATGLQVNPGVRLRPAAPGRCPAPVAKIPDDKGDPLPRGKVDWNKEMEILRIRGIRVSLEATLASTGRPASPRATTTSQLGIFVDWQWWVAALAGMFGTFYVLDHISHQSLVT